MPEPGEVSNVIKDRVSQGNPKQPTIVQNAAYLTGYTATTIIKELNKLVENGEIQRTDSGGYTTR